MAAARCEVYPLLLDPVAVARWRVPDRMSAEVHELDPRVGGRIRMSLTHHDPRIAGKTSGATDTYRGRYVDLVTDERVVEEIEFETEDDDLVATITMTTTLREVPGGTEIEIRMDGVPDALPRAQNQAGTDMALARLTGLVG